MPGLGDVWGEPLLDERAVRLDEVASAGSSFRYTYDFGDDWVHQVVVEEVLPADTGAVAPACVDGRRAGPPEDCGGPSGYRELLEVLADPSHPEHEAQPDGGHGHLRTLGHDHPAHLLRRETERAKQPELTRALQHAVHGVEGALCGLHEADAVSGIQLRLGEATDLAAHALRDGEAGGVVGGAVDPVAGRQASHRLARQWRCVSWPLSLWLRASASRPGETRRCRRGGFPPLGHPLVAPNHSQRSR